MTLPVETWHGKIITCATCTPPTYGDSQDYCRRQGKLPSRTTSWQKTLYKKQNLLSSQVDVLFWAHQRSVSVLQNNRSPHKIVSFCSDQGDSHPIGSDNPRTAIQYEKHLCMISVSHEEQDAVFFLLQILC